MIGLARLKLLLRRVITLVEFCRDCGRHQPMLWQAEDKLWEEVTGRTDGGGVYCPECFSRRADRMGITLRWVPQVDWTYRTLRYKPSRDGS